MLSNQLSGSTQKLFKTIKKRLMMSRVKPSTLAKKFVQGLSQGYEGDKVVYRYTNLESSTLMVNDTIELRDMYSYFQELESKTQVQKQRTILDWYYGNEINQTLKNSLINALTPRSDNSLRVTSGFEEENLFNTEEVSPLLTKIKDSISNQKLNNLDSMIELDLARFANNQNKIDYLLGLSRLFLRINQTRKSLEYIEKAYALSESFTVLRSIIDYYLYCGKYESVIQILTPLSTVQDVDKRIYIFITLGIAFNKLNKPYDAYLSLCSAQSCFDNLTPLQSNVHKNHHPLINKLLVHSSLKRGDIDKAESLAKNCLKKSSTSSLDECILISNTDEFESCYLYLGMILFAKNEWERAEWYFLQALKNFEYGRDIEQTRYEYVTIVGCLALIGIYAKEKSVTTYYLSILEQLLFVYGITTSDVKFYYYLIKSLSSLGTAKIEEAYLSMDMLFESLQPQSRTNDFYRSCAYAHFGNMFCRNKDYDRGRYYYTKLLGLTDTLLVVNTPLHSRVEEKIDNITISRYEIILIL